MLMCAVSFSVKNQYAENCYSMMRFFSNKRIKKILELSQKWTLSENELQFEHIEKLSSVYLFYIMGDI